MVYGKLTPEVLAIIMAQRFLMPFAFAHRWPTEGEIAKALEGLAIKGASDDELALFTKVLVDINNEAAVLMKTRGSA